MSDNNFYFPTAKKRNIRNCCKIVSSESYIPNKVISNEDIIRSYNLPFSSNAIIKTIGVKTRHIADESQADTDVLYESAEKCLSRYGLAPDSLSKLLVNKYFGDNLLPMTASKLQRKLGSKTAVQAFDIDGGISSFLHAVDAASRYINTGDEHILIASGGINYRLISKTDPRVAFLFGDGSASLLLARSLEEHILSSYFYSNCQYYELATALSPLSIVDMNDHSIANGNASILFDTYRMDNWKIAEDFYRQATTAVCQNLLEESGLCMNDIHMVLVTENNRKIWELTLEALGVYEERSISLLEKYGNTMSAMLPLLLDYGFKTGRIQQGMNIMLISHGEGISGGGLIYKV